MKTLLTLALLCSAVPVFAQEPETPRAKLLIPYTALVAGSAADVVSTYYGLQGNCRESNPLFGKEPSAVTIVASKALVVAPIAVAMHFANKHGHPKVAKFMGYYGGGLGVAMGARNAMLCH